MARRREPPDALDYFPTPPWATRALFRHVLPSIGVDAIGSAWEPACGEGHMAEVIGEFTGSSVTASDICSVCLTGETHEYRRHLFKVLLDEAWRFSNWLTHAKASTWYDAEAATTTVEHALGLATSLVIRHIRGAPEACPACGSNRLSPERGFHSTMPDVDRERPTCGKCGWVGEPVPILADPKAYRGDEKERPAPEGDCIISTVPLRSLHKPGRKR